MRLAILWEVRQIIEFRGWQPPLKSFPVYGPVNLLEAVFMACRFEVGDYRETCSYIAELLGGEEPSDVLKWETQPGRTEIHILQLIDKAENGLQELVKPYV